MKKRLNWRRMLSFLLLGTMIVSLFGGLAPSASAASITDTLTSANIFNGDFEMGYLTMNGAVKTQSYTYYMYSAAGAQPKEIPAYCISPTEYGVPQTVAPGESIEYIVDGVMSDPKAVGILANGYPHTTLTDLALDNKYQAFYATKMALWCYLIPSWNINSLGINPDLTGSERTIGERLLAAAKKIYINGTQWTSIPQPTITTAADKPEAYEVTIDGTTYLQQIFSVHSETWVGDLKIDIAFAIQDNADAVGAKIVDMDNKEITEVPVENSLWNYDGKYKILVPVENADKLTGGMLDVNLAATVYKYEMVYALCAETDKYGNLQKYLLDTDPVTDMAVKGVFTPPDGTPPPDGDPEPELETGLKIVKLEEGTKTPLAGAVYEVIAPDGTTLGSYSTGTDGTITIPITEIGNYTVTEKTAPRYHLLPDEPTQSVRTYYGKVSTVTFVNAPYGDLRVEKIDSRGGGGLAGARVQIKHIESGAIYVQETGPGGAAQFTQLKPGAYEISELSAPDGWQKDPQTYTVNVISGECVTFSLKNDALPGLKIIKYDSSSHMTMPHVTFEIFRDTVSLGRFETDALGEITLVDQKPGTYRVVEVDTGDTAHIIAPPQEIELTAGGGIKTLYFFNDTKPGMWLVKVDSADPSKAIPNAVFSIRAIDGSWGPKEYTTGQNGEIDLSELPTGSYEVVELSCPGYIIDKAQRIIHLEANQTGRFVFTNTAEPSIHIIKLSADGTPLPGVSFRIAKIEDGSHYLDRVTDQNGEILISGLEPGVYSVKETATVSNHILDSREYHVELFPGKTSTITIENQIRPNLTIYKHDADTGEPVPNTVFLVRAADGHSVDEIKTDSTGKATLTNLLPGVYEISEKSVPAPWLNDADPQLVTLYANRDHAVYFKNHKKPTLTVNKVDSVTGSPIKGAKFEVWYGSNNTTTGELNSLGTFYSDANGQFFIDSLRDGWYKVTELEPAPGFTIKEPATQEVYIKGGESKVLTFQNVPKNAIIVEKYDSVTGEALPGCTFQLKYLGGTSGTGGTVIGTKVTGKNGTAIWTGLKPGAYVLEEIDPADGYNIVQSSETIMLADNGEQSVITVRFKNTPDGILLIRKVCATNPSMPLQNAEFKVAYADGTLIGDSNGVYRTDEAGEVRITGLKPGKSVVVSETRAPGGFILDTQSQTIQIKEGKTVSLTFKNQPKGALIIQKRDSQTNEPLSGAEFRITTAAGCEVGLDGVIGTSTLTQNGIFTTDAQGEIRISNLAPGAYIINEIKAPDGGYVIDTPSTNVVIGQGGDTQTVVIKNTRKGGLIVEKYDSVTKQPLSGAQFKIMNANGELTPDNEGTTSSNGLYTTNAEGQIVLSKLRPDTYIVTEVRSPEHYQGDPTPQTVVVNAGDTQTLRFYNDPLCTLTILKRDAVTQKPLKGAEFTVKDSEGRTVGPDNGRYVTGTDGTVTVTGLAPNATIVVSESKAPTGYIKDETPKNIVVRSGVSNSLTFDNEPATTLIIRKFVEGTENEPLSGVAFKVVDGSGAAVGPDDGVYYTDKAGEIVLEGLEPGTTVIAREIKSVEGYLLDGTPQDIKIEAGTVQQLTFWNKKAGELVIRKFVEGTENEPLSGVAFKVVDGSGAAVGPDDGVYYTDKSGEIVLEGLKPGATIVAREIKSVEGYVLDGTPQDIKIEAGTVQQLTFWNKKAGELVIRKLDSVTKQPLAGVEFELTYAGSSYVDNANGHLSSNGLYTTDSHGEIHISGVTGTIVVKETRTIPGYTIDESTRIQTVVVNPQDTQTLTFYNAPKQSLTIQKYVDGTTIPIQGVTFLVTDSSGQVLGPNNGEYMTDKNGRIVLTDLVPGTTITAKETKTAVGYVLDATPQSILIKEGEAQTMTFFNKAEGGLELIKVSESNKTQRIPNTTFEIRRMDGGLVDTVTTNRNGRVHLDLDAGDYYAVEIEAAEGFKIDNTPHYFTIQDGKTTTLTVTNAPFSGIIIHKVDSVTGEGIYDVKFLVYDQNKNPIGEYSTDNEGYIYIDDLTVQGKGKLFIRELEAAPGYELDKEYKTVYVQPGKTVEIEWENTPITGQFQIHKYAAEYNEVTGTSAGAPLQGAVYEISEARSGKVVDYITTDARGVAASRPLPLGRYKIVEVTAPAYWQVSGTVFDETLEYSGQIIKLSDYDKPSSLGVSITKRGNAEALAGNQMRYDFTVANTSNVPLENFYWHDRIPTDAARATVFTTGTYSARLNYRILYKTNYSATYQVLASNLLTSSSYSFSLNAIPTQAREYVTDVYLDFGKVPVGFQSTSNPTLTVQILGTAANGYQVVNRADVGGKYQGTWQTAQASWVTVIRKYGPTPSLPKTGY